jgi:hypothetical protein
MSASKISYTFTEVNVSNTLWEVSFNKINKKITIPKTLKIHLKHGQKVSKIREDYIK